MSSFDTVNFLCPKCGSILSKQSKGGPCKLENHSAFKVPIAIAGSIIDDSVTCEECFETFTIKPEHYDFVVLRLAERE